MTYGTLLKKLQKLTPEELKQKVKLEEGCSGNVTEVTCLYKALKDEYWDLNESEKLDGLTDEDRQLKFKKGQIRIFHDH